MNESELFVGRHHWKDSKLFARSKEFMIETLGFEDPTPYEVWSKFCLIILSLLHSYNCTSEPGQRYHEDESST